MGYNTLELRRFQYVAEQMVIGVWQRHQQFLVTIFHAEQLKEMNNSQLDPQAGAVSRIRRRIFVRQKSAEKVWLAEYYSRRKYRYTTTVSVC